MKWLQLIVAEGLLGYLLQCGACISGICAVAKKRVPLGLFLITSVLFAIAIFLAREVAELNFGVHTMTMLLVVNLLCVFLLKIDLRSSILGSLLLTAVVLVGELLDYGILMLFFNQADIEVHMAEPVFKAWAAVPGNVLLGIGVAIAYFKRTAARK